MKDKTQLGAVSVPGETAAGAQKQDHSSEIAELEQEASLMRARNERLQAERDELLEALQKLLSFADTSDDCQYGTIGTSFLRQIALPAIAKAGGSQ